MQNDPNGSALVVTVIGLFLFFGVPILLAIYDEIKTTYFRRIEARKPIIYNLVQTPAQAIVAPPPGKRNRNDRQRTNVRTPENIQTLYKQQKGKCWWCSNDLLGVYHVDHRVPFSKGGTDDLGNLCLSCPKCNHEKYDKLHFKGRLI